jgi:molybdopterin-guanine dinucleotide biosynthesis adapter protein
MAETDNRPPPLVGIVGWSGAGKTTLLTRLVAELSQRGLKVATIKSAHHPLRSHDGTTDGERHAQAGATAVAVLAPGIWEISGIAQAGPPPALHEVAARLAPADIILVEGMKRAAIPKIEVRSLHARSTDPLAASDARIFAIAADHPIDAATVPVFARDDAPGLARLVATRILHL